MRYKKRLVLSAAAIFVFFVFQNMILKSPPNQFTAKLNPNAFNPTASAYDEVHYWVQTHDLTLCGQKYEMVAFVTDNPLVSIESSPLGPDSKRTLAHLATHVTDSRINPAHPVHLVLQGSPTLSSGTPLMLFPRSVSLSKEKDCFRETSSYGFISSYSSATFKTDFVTAEVSKSGFRFDLSPHYYASDIGKFTDAQAQVVMGQSTEKSAGASASGTLQHLIVYSAPYQAQAQRLALYHNQHGLNSLAVLVDTLPGLGEQDNSIPTACNAPYLQECFYVQDAQHARMPGVDPGLVSGLFGMIPLKSIPVGTAPFRVKDRAGLIRAALRSYMITNPNFNYVVFMGDLASLPMRYSDWDPMALSYAPADNINKTEKLPVDAYYRDPIAPWVDNPTREPSYVTIQDMLYPNKQTSDNSFTGPYNPANFYWPLRMPHSRYLMTPSGYSDRLLAVGRITGKIPGSDADVKEVVDRTINWNNHPLPANSTVEANEQLDEGSGVAGTATLEGYEAGYGAFKYFGAGFGNAYPPSASAFTSAGCVNYPATNDWHAFIAAYNANSNSDPLGAYMSNPDSCWPTTQLSDGKFPLPVASNVSDYIAQHGAGFIIFDTHGGPTGTGFSPHSSGFSSSNDESTSPENAGVNQFTFVNPTQPNGFAVASSCEVSPIQGGAYWKWPDYYSSDTYAETWLNSPGAGVVGVLFNYVEGLSDGGTGADGGFNIQFGAAVKTIQSYSQSHRNAVVRVGDALNLLFSQRLANYGAYNDYQAMNRVYLGDPAAILPGVYLRTPPPPATNTEKGGSKL